MQTLTMVEVSPETIDEYGIFCSRNKKEEGYQKKREWLLQRFSEGLKIRIIKTDAGRDVGFIEYIPGEYAWRPVSAKDYLFIHCIYVAHKEDRGLDLGSRLLGACLEDAVKMGFKGVAAACSEGPWMAGRSLFEKNGFEVADRLGRFELLVKKLVPAPSPVFINWEAEQAHYHGWRLVFSHQCPWHAKACRELKAAAEEVGIPLKVTEITDASSARHAPSGFGVFALLHEGKLLADHYISRRRFLNILEEEGLRR